MNRAESDVIALALIIIGVILLFLTMSLWFWGSLVIFISFLGAAYAIVASAEREERIKKMEERIKKLEAEKEKEN